MENDKKEKAEIIFSTVHRCKGMEYDAVQLVNDFITEEKLVKIKSEPDEEPDKAKLNEEINLLYVAVTRTRNILHIPEALMPKEFPPSAQIRILRTVSEEDKREMGNLKYQNASRRKTGRREVAEEIVTPKRTYVDEISERPKDAYKPWTDEEDDELTVMYCEGVNMRAIAKHLGRTKGAIKSRIKKLELEEIYGEGG